MSFEHFNFMNFLVALLGATIHVLFDVYISIKKNEDTFSFAVLFADPLNYIRFALTVLSIVALMLMIEDIGHLTKLPLAFNLLGVGWFNFSIIERLVKMFEKTIGPKG